MADFVEKVKEDLQSLKTLRDELRVKANLGAMDVKDLWRDAERRWQEAEQKRQELEKASIESAREVAAALQQVVTALQEGYQKIRSKL